MMGTNVIRNFL